MTVFTGRSRANCTYIFLSRPEAPSLRRVLGGVCVFIVYTYISLLGPKSSPYGEPSAVGGGRSHTHALG